jgi:uncharacterized integral membrane protein (TIGR00698 family)
MTTFRTPPSSVNHPPAQSPSVIPGLLLAGAAALLAYGVQRLVPAASPLLVAILLGVAVAHSKSLPDQMRPGLKVASKRVLRLGIVVLGLQLSLRDIAGLGWGTIGVVVAVVALGIVLTLAIGKRLGVPAQLRLLIACGFSICGAAAVAAVAGATDSDEEDVAASIGLVVLFGTAMIGICPFLLPALGLTERQQGLVAGGSIHEVAQVVAVGGILGGTALTVAIVVKLARVLMLAPVILTISAQRRRSGQVAEGEKLPPLMPLFVAGFLAMVLIRSFLPVPDVALHIGSITQTVLLSAAMFALGTGLHIGMLKKVGGRPVLLAAVSTIGVFAIAYGGVLVTS